MNFVCDAKGDNSYIFIIAWVAPKRPFRLIFLRRIISQIISKWSASTPHYFSTLNSIISIKRKIRSDFFHFGDIRLLVDYVLNLRCEKLHLIRRYRNKNKFPGLQERGKPEYWIHKRQSFSEIIILSQLSNLKSKVKLQEIFQIHSQRIKKDKSVNYFGLKKTINRR